MDESTTMFSSEQLLPLVYEELRKLASQKLAREWGPLPTLQPTALVHEVWIRVGMDGSGEWRDEAHFFGAAAQAMRRILVERARAKLAAKRMPPREFDEERWHEHDDHILMIHECLGALEKRCPEAARVVLLKFYGGLSTAEIARIEGMSARTVERLWMYAKAKLYQLIGEASDFHDQAL